MLIKPISCLLLCLASQAAMAKSPVVLWDMLLLKNSPNPQDKKKYEALSKETFRIPGYMVPLESNPKVTKEFIFVPSLPSCIHVPPPPANQTIHVKMKTGTTAPLSWDAVWVEGRIKESKSTIKDYGEVGFEMESDAVVKVRTEELNEINKMLPKSTYVMDCTGVDKLDPACASKVGPSRKPSNGKP